MSKRQKPRRHKKHVEDVRYRNLKYYREVSTGMALDTGQEINRLHNDLRQAREMRDYWTTQANKLEGALEYLMGRQQQEQQEAQQAATAAAQTAEAQTAAQVAAMADPVQPEPAIAPENGAVQPAEDQLRLVEPAVAAQP